MEGKNFENAENNAEWKKLKDEAPTKATELISKIEGFDSLAYEAQVDALNALLDTLVEDNDNRFVAREVARTLEVIKETERHRIRMGALGVAA